MSKTNTITARIKPMTPKIEAPPPVEPKEERGRVSYEAPSRRGKKGVTFHITPNAHRQLTYLAWEQDSSVQELLIRALNMLFEEHRKPPIA